jgi:hypothetical protein
LINNISVRIQNPNKNQVLFNIQLKKPNPISVNFFLIENVRFKIFILMKTKTKTQYLAYALKSDDGKSIPKP